MNQASNSPSVPRASQGSGTITELKEIDGPGAFSFLVTDSVAGATGTLHGGCGLAATGIALERVTGRPISFIAGQYLSRAPVGSTVQVHVEELAVGNRVTQAAALITLDQQIVLRASAALGGHDLGIDRQWCALPEVPPPGECESRPLTSESGNSFTDQADIRLAGQVAGENTVMYWARLTNVVSSNPDSLIALADLIPSGMRVSLDAGFRGSSLDHSVKITGTGNSDWGLLRITSSAIRNSIGHGAVEIFSPDGQLLAVGSQSFAISSITGVLDR